MVLRREGTIHYLRTSRQVLFVALIAALFPASLCQSPAFMALPGTLRRDTSSPHNLILYTDEYSGRVNGSGRSLFGLTVLRGQKEDSDQDKQTLDEWNDKHLAHGATEIRLDTDKEVIKAEDEATFDALGQSDPGMEAAALERSLMMAEEWAERKQEEAAKNSENGDTQQVDKSKKWNEKHLAHGAENFHIETEDEVEESEDEVAFDAHDLSDPGMEAAALERSLMMAEEWAEKKQKEAAKNSEKGDTQQVDKSKKWNNKHLAHGASTLHIETEDEVEESEDEVAFDAHDLSDPGMEAAALERSLMMAEEWAKKMKKEAKAKKNEKEG